MRKSVWKLQKRAEREKGCRQAWAAGRAAGKPEDPSPVPPPPRGGLGALAEGQGVRRQRARWGCTRGPACSPQTQQRRLPGSCPLLSPSLPSFSSPISESRWVSGEKLVSVGNRRGKPSWASVPGRRELSTRCPRARGPSSDGAPRAGLPSASTWSQQSLKLSLVAPASVSIEPQRPVRNIPLVLGF